MKLVYEDPCTNWEDMSSKLRNKEFKTHWIFRGECLPENAKPEMNLQTSLNKVCSDFNLKLNNVLKVEEKMMRDFRRKYDGPDRRFVESDTLYCISLMRHYGAPTRLLDWTYSPFVAAYFALEKWHPTNSPEVVIWCLSDKWCYESFIKAYPKLKKDLDRYKKIHDSKNITLPQIEKKNALFDKLFMKNKYDYVYPVNPMATHARLNVQQSVLLCPGRATTPLLQILESLSKNNSAPSVRNPIRKFYWKVKNKTECLDALDELHLSNISRISLFPGAEGFAQSLKFRLRFYEQL